MQGIPWSTIALGSLLLISARSTGGQEVQSPQPEKSKPPVKTEQRGRIIGIGGVFFKSANRDQMREWYAKHLGLADKGQGVMLPWREHDDPQKEHVTVWTVFPASTKYFDPSPAPFMINYIVDDMDALLDRLKQEGVKIDPKRMDESYGRFAWIYDRMGIRLSSGSRCPQSPKGLPLHLLNRRWPGAPRFVVFETWDSTAACISGLWIFRRGAPSASALLRRQKLNCHVAARRFEIKVRCHKNVIARIGRQFYPEGVHVRNVSFQLDQ